MLGLDIKYAVQIDINAIDTDMPTVTSQDFHVIVSQSFTVLASDSTLTSLAPEFKIS
ncbi:MAG: hypothetical protein PG978_001249 [Wolbachia endosymbiont of Ctenocephalides felis wCfeF]|nr:MAG: hypothetical protein PG978_001249 [Wolbachia endosymbiont of Ctenocephalides felis wCfeF]